MSVFCCFGVSFNVIRVFKRKRHPGKSRENIPAPDVTEGEYMIKISPECVGLF